MLKSLVSLGFVTAALAQGGNPSMKLKTYVDTLDLEFGFSPVKEAYWTGLPHHRRTPFAVSENGKTGFLAYLDASGSDVHLQHISMSTMKTKGPAITIKNVKEAGGLVAHDQGFALLGNEPIPSGTANAPPGGTPVPAIYRYQRGKPVWKTFLAGPGVHPDDGLMMSPDMNGDLVYSPESDMFAAYFVVTAYSGFAEGHFGDSIEYVDSKGTLKTIEGASSAWGCSHNTGIAFEAAAEPPFASICAEDHGAIWLNTGATGMSNTGTKISNENVQNGASNEPMGGMSGSYSSLAKFQNSTEYIFTWVSRGAIDLTVDDWMGEGYTQAKNRTNGRRTAMALFSDKSTLIGKEATSQVGAANGDSQVNWVTEEEGPDRSNAHVATFDDTYALVSWEEAANPVCANIAMGCAGQFTGTYFQLVNKSGDKIGQPMKKTNVYVAGDMVTTGDGRICWPYVNMNWSLDAPQGYGGSSAANVKKMSFACMSLV